MSWDTPTNIPTAFMTSGESNRIQETIKDRLKECKRLSGQARVPIDALALKQAVTGAALMADIAGMPEPGLIAQAARCDAMTVLPLGPPYLPCTLAAKDLHPMSFSELRVHTHHRGRLVTLRRVGPVVRLVASSWTVVEDTSSGEQERLEVYMHRTYNGEDILDSASMFTLKEPFYTINDQIRHTLRIDHPSDLVIHMDSIGKDQTDEPKSAPNTAEEYKVAGNAALKQKFLLDAYARYTEGLQVATSGTAANENMARDLYRNRAYVNLGLNRLDEAKSDALASLTREEDQRSKELDSKAFFRAGCAMYNLGDFREAKRLFIEQQNLMPGDEAAKAFLHNINLRLRQQETGEYNMKKIKAGLSKARPRVDAASFNGDTVVRDSPGQGRGLFTTRDIAANAIIICEKAFSVVWAHEPIAWNALTYDTRDANIRVSAAGLTQAVVQKLRNNPSLVEKVLDLCSNWAGTGKQLILNDSFPAIDTFQVHDIVSRNAFTPGAQYGDEQDIGRASAGLWIRADYANHSCLPNTTKEFLGDLLILRALRPIAAGEQVTHCYHASPDYDDRCTALMRTWGFICDCSLCRAEVVDGPDLRARRRELRDEADAFVEKESPVGAKRVTIVRAERLARSIDETYDAKRYCELPRPMSEGIRGWIYVATERR